MSTSRKNISSFLLVNDYLNLREEQDQKFKVKYNEGIDCHKQFVAATLKPDPYSIKVKSYSEALMTEEVKESASIKECKSDE